MSSSIPESSAVAMGGAGAGVAIAATASPREISLPRLIVFDLDYTLWPFEVEKLSPPFALGEDRIIRDSTGRDCSCFPETIPVLERAIAAGIPIAIASRTGKPDFAEALLRLIRLPSADRSIFEALPSRDFFQAFPEKNKKKHFENVLAAMPGASYNQFLFFDDDQAIIDGVKAVTAVGGKKINSVVCIKINETAGVTLKDLECGFGKFTSRGGRRSRKEKKYLKRRKSHKRLKNIRLY